MTAPEEGRPVRIGLVADTLTGHGGIGRYVREVTSALGNRADVELVMVVSDNGRNVLADLAPENLVATVRLPGDGQIARALGIRHTVARALARHGVEIVHGCNQLLPRRLSVASVLTVHDVMPITWPAQFRLAKRLLLPRQFRASLVGATAIVAVSQATAGRLTTLDPQLASKVNVIPNGVASALLTVEAEALPELVGREFALVVSDLSPRKNVALLCDIWGEVAAATGLVLVFVGPEGWRAGRVRERLDELIRGGLAVRFEQITDAQLRWCYEQARLVALPTLEEGFGLPAIEALALGATVVASTDPAVVEASQGRAIHLDPHDSAAWTQTIVDVARGVRTVPGESRIRVPTWAEHVDRLVDVYRQVIVKQRARSA